MKNKLSSLLLLSVLSLSVLSFSAIRYCKILQKDNVEISMQNENLKYNIKNFQDKLSEYESTIATQSEEMFNDKKEYELAITNYDIIAEENTNLLEDIDNFEEKITYLQLQIDGLKLYIEKANGIKISEVAKANFDITKYTDAMGAWALDDPRLGTMANGEKTHIGAAAMPKSIPFGTQIVIDDKLNPTATTSIVYTTKDRGGAVVTSSRGGERVYRMDVWTNTYEDAIEWAKRSYQGYLYFIE